MSADNDGIWIDILLNKQRTDTARMKKVRPNEVSWFLRFPPPSQRCLLADGLADRKGTNGRFIYHEWSKRSVWIITPTH